MTVLVLTADDDDTATRVCEALDGSGVDHARMDLGDFPENLALTATLEPGSAWAGVLSSRDRDLAVTEISAVYYRRPSTFRAPVHAADHHDDR